MVVESHYSFDEISILCSKTFISHCTSYMLSMVKKRNRFFGVHVVYSSLRAICGTQDVNNHSNHPVTLDGREGEGMIKGMIIDTLVKKGCVKRERRGIATKISRSRVRIATEVLVTSKTRRPRGRRLQRIDIRTAIRGHVQLDADVTRPVPLPSLRQSSMKIKLKPNLHLFTLDGHHG